MQKQVKKDNKIDGKKMNPIIKVSIMSTDPNNRRAPRGQAN
jgi:hypothetical protein